jgi:hypothetical protein
MFKSNSNNFDEEKVGGSLSKRKKNKNKILESEEKDFDDELESNLDRKRTSSTLTAMTSILKDSQTLSTLTGNNEPKKEDKNYAVLFESLFENSELSFSFYNFLLLDQNREPW